MSWWLLLIFLLAAVILLVILRVPVAYAILAVNIIFAMVLFTAEQAAEQVVLGSIASVTKFTLAPVPLFILMGALLSDSGAVAKAIDILNQMLGKIPARLPVLAVASGTMLGILSGSSMATTAVLGRSLVPKMLDSGYKKRISVGSVLASGGLAMVLPPSAMIVVMGAVGNIQIGKLLIAGIVPGIIMALSYIVILLLWTFMFKAAPSKDDEYIGIKPSRKKRIVDATINLVPLGVIVFLVLGFIFLGIATPTESAALGVVASAVLGLVRMRGKPAFLVKALYSSTKISATIFIILLASSVYSQLLSFSGATRGLVLWLTSIETSEYIIFIGMQLVVVFLGFFLEQISILMLTLPLYMPVVMAYDWNPIWFGIITLINIQIASTSPPFGLNLFVMRSVAPRSIQMNDIYMGAIPFIASDIIVMILIGLLPAIALWLPGMIG